MHLPLPTNCPSSVPREHRSRGFSLIELIVVIIIVGILAAIAVPRYIALGRDARLASLQALTGTLWTAANNVHTMCALAPGCDYGVFGQRVMISGINTWLNYGWPEAGDFLDNGEIDSWVNYAGFTISFPDTFHHKFSLDGAPDPSNCAVIYQQAWNTLSTVPVITSLTSGC